MKSLTTTNIRIVLIWFAILAIGLTIFSSCTTAKSCNGNGKFIGTGSSTKSVLKYYKN